jgi:phosphatidate cytidylyltransferase
MTRLLSGAALGAAVLAAILWLPAFGLLVLASAVAALAAREYVAIVHRDGRAPRASPILLLVVATCWWMSLAGRTQLFELVIAASIWVAFEVVLLGMTIERAAARAFALWYIGMPLGMLAAIHAAAGPATTILLLATVVVSDTAQYYTGRLFGRRPLAPAISPKKTIEGAVGGAVLGTLFLVVAGGSVLPAATPLSLAALGLVVVLVGIFGDLFESRLKRVAGMKDSATLIPGHGGVLDRIDALLFATPVFYLYLFS